MSSSVHELVMDSRSSARAALALALAAANGSGALERPFDAAMGLDAAMGHLRDALDELERVARMVDPVAAGPLARRADERPRGTHL